ncbi:MAG: exodeoxyribonuclease VII large subunit [Deltaproteobacteria bacterium]|nr:exodeoxyribonuclease VII large subunit [Deltaproteobacteria bacterium]
MSGPRSILTLFDDPRGPAAPAQPGGKPADGARPQSVTEVVRASRMLVEQRFPRVRVQGEVSDYRARGSAGHLYFTLKDQVSALPVVMWESDARRLRFKLAAGQQVIATGKLTLYEAQGRFQLQATALEPAGQGALAAAYEALRARLEAEGLFAPARKKQLPAHPRVVGVVTSPEGAAWQDVLRVLRRRAPGVHVLLSAARVQGAGASQEIAAALTRLDRDGRADVIIVARGGGAAEDLAAFNDEALARALAACATPVVSGVGHETDTTICDWVADVRAPTPSAAAELVVPDRQKTREALAHLHERLQSAMAGKGRAAELALLRLQQRLGDGRDLLRPRAQALDDLDERLRHALRRRTRETRERLTACSTRLDRAHPVRHLRAQRERLDRLRGALQSAATRRRQLARERVTHAAARLERARPERRLRAGGDALARLEQRLRGAFDRAARAARERWSTDAARLQALSPLAVLSRGYAVVQRAPDGTVVRDPADAPAGTELSVRVAGGVIDAVSRGGSKP